MNICIYRFPQSAPLFQSSVKYCSPSGKSLHNCSYESCFCSKEDVEFSMIASRTKVKTRFPDNYISTDCGEDVLKTAVIVGEKHCKPFFCFKECFLFVSSYTVRTENFVFRDQDFQNYYCCNTSFTIIQFCFIHIPP